MEKLVTIFKVPELRQKILITLMFLAIYRVGYWIPVPVLDQHVLDQWAQGLMTGGFGQLLGMAQMFSGASIGMSTIFGLGIMPYISASIIFQLLASVYPPLEKLAKEGESGRKKINEYTRYATVVLCLGQSAMWVRYLMSQDVIPSEYSTFGYGLVTVLTMTAGTIFLMWIGEQIDEYGIGNGISLLIMAGIVARMPAALGELYQKATSQLSAGPGHYGVDTILTLMILFVGVVIGVVAMTQAQRRIPTQSAKHVRGRRVYGGQRQYLPLKLNQSGVMPIIFASSLLMFPYFFFSWLQSMTEAIWIQQIARSFIGEHGFVYNVLYIALIYFFCYFWTAITFNPKDMANNLKDHGSFIPGYRPGRRTSEYLEKVMVRITYVGAAFLAVVAIIPTVISGSLLGGSGYLIASFYGGTGLLIVISVGLDLVQKIDSHLIMRNYAGLMERR